MKSSASLVVVATVLAACGGGGGGGITTPPPSSSLPVLGEATGATLNNCAALANFGFANTTISAATSIAAGTLTVAGKPVPAHCQVRGKMFERIGTVDGQPYAIGFEMRLPINWNGRFFYQANGGTDGAVSTAVGALGGGPLTNALAQGFAVISSDAGHNGAQNPTFGIDPQARLDYATRPSAS